MRQFSILDVLAHILKAAVGVIGAHLIKYKLYVVKRSINPDSSA